jgi:hypothetical protein
VAANQKPKGMMLAASAEQKQKENFRQVLASFGQSDLFRPIENRPRRQKIRARLLGLS